MTCRVVRSGPALPPFSFPAILPTHGWWDDDAKITCCVAAYQAIGADSYADSLVNLANPGTYNLTAGGGGAPGWDDTNGWNIAGSKYLLSGYYPASRGTYIARFSGGVGAGSKMVLGACIDIACNYQVELLPWDYGGTKRQWGNGLYRSMTGGVASGRMAVADQRCFLNGAYQANLTADIGVFASLSQLCIGAGYYEPTNVAVQIWPGYVQAAAFYSCTLTDAEVAQVDAELAAL